MGQKVQPTGFRLGITEEWRSRWYADKNYAENLGNDLAIREFLNKRLEKAALSRVDIERAGDKVKVTLLATGFGLRDVEGMDDHIVTRSRQEQDETDSRTAEIEDAKNQRRSKYYGDGASTKNYKRHPHIFIFKPEELDNDDIILKVDDLPTYQRTSQQYHNIRRHSIPTDNNVVMEKKVPVQGTISFSDNT